MLKAHKIQADINHLKDTLIVHQTKCKHVKATKSYKGNTGNYDPSSNCYWIDWCCPTCLKQWTTPQ